MLSAFNAVLPFNSFSVSVSISNWKKNRVDHINNKFYKIYLKIEINKRIIVIISI